MAHLTEVPKTVTKTLFGLPVGNTEWVALSRITINDVSNLEGIITGTFNVLAGVEEYGWVQLGETLIKPEGYISFTLK